MPGIDITDHSITFSQSWLNTLENCPQQALLELRGELPRIESDATALGTACHAGFEAVCNGASLTDGEAVAIDLFHELTLLSEFRWVQIKTMETAERTLQRVYWTWANEVWPQLAATFATELPFDITLGVTSGQGRELRIKGSIDFADEFQDLSDWKCTRLRHWSQRSADTKLQATAYLLAMRELYGEADRQFHYVVIDKQAQEHSIFTTTRTEADYRWLIRKAQHAAALIEADLEVWPLSPVENALCSAKWCSAWDSCRGMTLL